GVAGAAATGALSQAANGPAEIVRHLLGHQRFCRDRGISGAATHGEIVTNHDHGAAIDRAATADAVRRRQILQFALFIILADTGNSADLVKALRVNEFVNPLANGEPALVVLPLDLVNASHL